MRTSIYAAVLLVTLSLAGSACSDSDTPTQTFTVLDSFSGTWSGSVASGPAGVDWDPMELLLGSPAGA